VDYRVLREVAPREEIRVNRELKVKWARKVTQTVPSTEPILAIVPKPLQLVAAAEIPHSNQALLCSTALRGIGSGITARTS
jgi:hypothetical protein